MGHGSLEQVFCLYYWSPVDVVITAVVAHQDPKPADDFITTFDHKLVQTISVALGRSTGCFYYRVEPVHSVLKLAARRIQVILITKQKSQTGKKKVSDQI